MYKQPVNVLLRGVILDKTVGFVMKLTQRIRELVDEGTRDKLVAPRTKVASEPVELDSDVIPVEQRIELVGAWPGGTTVLTDRKTVGTNLRTFRRE